MRWSHGATATLLLVITACSSEPILPDTFGTDAPAPAGSAVTLQEVSVIGGGRATTAASATGDATVVGTTIGVNVVDANGTATVIGSGVDLPPTNVTVSPDGGYVAIEGAASTELWALGAAPTGVGAFDTPVRATFSADSSLLMTSSPLEVKSGPVAAPQTVITAPEGTGLGAAAMTADGQAIAVPVTGGGSDVITYSASTGAVSTDVFTDPARQVARLEFGNRAELLLLQVGSEDPFAGQLVAWDTGTGQTSWETAVGSFTPTTVWEVGPDGRVLAANDATLRLVGLEGTIDAEWQLDGTRAVTAIAATTDGYALALADGTLVLTGPDGNPTGPSAAIGRRIVDLKPLAGAAGVVTVDSDGIVQTWGPDATQLGAIAAYRAGPVNDVMMSADDSSVAAAMSNGTVMITDLAQSAPPMMLDHPEGNVDSVAFSPTGDQVVTGVGERLSDVAFDDTVSTWNLGDGLRTGQFGGEGEDVNGCANFRNTVRYSPRGDLFASTSHDFTVEVRRADSSEVVATLPPHVSSVLDVEFSPTGDRLVTTSDDGAVRVWSMADFSLQSEFVGPPGGYWAIAFMPDGNSLVASDLTGTMRRLDVATGTEMLVFSGATTRNGRLDVSPDGTLVAAASDGNTVGIWSTETGALVGSADGHTSPVTSAHFSSDGTMLVTGSGDTTVRTWQVAQA